MSPRTLSALGGALILTLATAAGAPGAEDRLAVQAQLRAEKSAHEKARLRVPVTGQPPSTLGELQRVGDTFVDADGRAALVPSRELREEDRGPKSHLEKWALLGLELPAAPGIPEPRRVLEKPAEVEIHDRVDPTMVMFKFRDEVPVRLRGGRLESTARSSAEWETVLGSYPEKELLRAFRTGEAILDADRGTGEALSGRVLPDLNNWYLARFPAGSVRGVDLANELLALDAIEVAYLQAIAEPPFCGDFLPNTPDWEDAADFLGPPPEGVNAHWAHAYHPGADGPGNSLWVADLEWGWCVDHEDLDITAGDIVNGNTGFSANAENHGTAVLGILGACDNANGVKGITPDIAMKMFDFDSEPTWGSNISTATSFLAPGDIMLLEIHIGGPDTGTSCPCNCSQFEYVPVEWDQAAFDAIQTATANGIIVVEAAGNGSVNLDWSVYQNRFQRWFRDSGAIMVAATEYSQAASCFTNHGSRIDAHGIGGSVVTTGYGDLFNPADCRQRYTNSFGGTSSASPMVTGACASLQGYMRERWGYTMLPAAMRSWVVEGGTPDISSTKETGLMPDLEAAIHALEPDWRPNRPAGWTGEAVPRLTGNATFGSAILSPLALPEGSDPARGHETFFNWASQIAPGSLFGSISGAVTGLTLDDEFLWTCLGGGQAPGSWQYCTNVSRYVKGGRHTVQLDADYLDVELEGDETNNHWEGQFIWEGLKLDVGESTVQTADPLSTAGSIGWYNAQGFEGDRYSENWHAFAVLPADGLDDFDIRFNQELPLNSPQQGFGAYEVWSSDGPGQVDFVLADRTTYGPSTSWASVLWFGGAGDPKRVQFQGSFGTISTPGVHGAFTIPATGIVGIHELWVDAGDWTVEVNPIFGDSDIGISVYNNATGLFAKDDALPGAYTDAFRGWGPETVTFTATQNDRFGLVVWKPDHGNISKGVTYHVILQPATAVGVDPVTSLPTALALAAPRPNPASGPFSLAFDVPADAGHVTLDVYDLGGRRVARLVDGSVEAGRHTARWDGQDQTGLSAAAGVYFARLQAGAETITRKITLLP
ncbi:MAG: S8 family serine peptidase [bacterium]